MNAWAPTHSDLVKTHDMGGVRKVGLILWDLWDTGCQYYGGCLLGTLILLDLDSNKNECDSLNCEVLSGS